MVNVRMGKNDVRQLFRIESQMPVEGVRVGTMSLEHATIQQDLPTVLQFQQVFRAGHCSGSTVKSDLHGFQLVHRNYEELGRGRGISPFTTFEP